MRISNIILISIHLIFKRKGAFPVSIEVYIFRIVDIIHHLLWSFHPKPFLQKKNNALAYAGLADSYVLLGEYRLAPGREVFPKAREAAAQALALNDTLAEAHTSLADIKVDYD